MNDRCKHCPLLFCDILSRGCRLKASEIFTLRFDLVGVVPRPALKAKRKWYAKHYTENREAEIARVTKWQAENKERRNAYFRERYARKNNEKAGRREGAVRV